MAYQHLFFDLDHTLWDFERNSAESLAEIYDNFQLESHGVASALDFATVFSTINLKLWNDFDRGRIAHGYIREHRFRLVFEAIGVQKPAFSEKLGEEYLEILPQKAHLLDGAAEILAYLAAKNYPMHIVTNGFDSIQARKMVSSGIAHYFENVVTNEQAGAKKPDPQIFAHALGLAKATPNESIMIGDNWIADVQGAIKFGIDAVFYNPKKFVFEEKPTYDIQHLAELKAIL